MATSVPGLVIYIYTLSDPRTDEVRYVGQTPNPAQRLKAHCNPHTARRSTYVYAWIRGLLAAGLTPLMTVIEFCDEATWVEAEQRQIAFFRAAGCRLTNTTKGGDGSYGMRYWLGRRHTEESRRKMSESMRAAWQRRRAGIPAEVGPEQPLRGRPLSEAHRAKISAALKGRKLSPEHIAKVAARQTGRKQSPEHAAKSRVAHKGVPMSLESREKIGAAQRGVTRSAEARANLAAYHARKRAERCARPPAP